MRFPSASTITDVRNLLSFWSVDLQTSQLQATTGIPCEVPVPRKVSTIEINS
jgi:hypothetical protein